MTSKKKAVTKKEIQAAGADGRTTRKKRAPATAPQERTAWTGFSEEDLKRPGATLLLWLHQRANQEGWTLRDLAERIGVTYGYLSQLRNGTRQVRHISDEFADSCAHLLGLPRLAVLLASGRLQPEDFYVDSSLVRDRVRDAAQILRADPEWGALIPADLDACSYEVQRLVVLLFEKATGRAVLPDAVDVDDLLSKFRNSSPAA